MAEQFLEVLGASSFIYDKNVSSRSSQNQDRSQQQNSVGGIVDRVKKDRKCFICGRSGHIVKGCLNRFSSRGWWNITVAGLLNTQVNENNNGRGGYSNSVRGRGRGRADYNNSPQGDNNSNVEDKSHLGSACLVSGLMFLVNGLLFSR